MSVYASAVRYGPEHERYYQPAYSSFEQLAREDLDEYMNETHVIIDNLKQQAENGLQNGHEDWEDEFDEGVQDLRNSMNAQLTQVTDLQKNRIRQLPQSERRSAASFVTSLLSGFKAIISSIISGLSQVVRWIRSKVRHAWEHVKDIFRSIGRLFRK